MSHWDNVKRRELVRNLARPTETCEVCGHTREGEPLIDDATAAALLEGPPPDVNPDDSIPLSPDEWIWRASAMHCDGECGSDCMLRKEVYMKLQRAYRMGLHDGHVDTRADVVALVAPVGFLEAIDEARAALKKAGIKIDSREWLERIRGADDEG